jgi:hypothetical protein
MGIELILPDEYATETLRIPCRPNIMHNSLDHDREKHAKRREIVPNQKTHHNNTYIRSGNAVLNA